MYLYVSPQISDELYMWPQEQTICLIAGYPHPPLPPSKRKYPKELLAMKAVYIILRITLRSVFDSLSKGHVFRHTMQICKMST